MDVRELLELVKQAEIEEIDSYALAAKIVEAQREADAQIAEALGSAEIAAAIRVPS